MSKQEIMQVPVLYSSLLEAMVARHRHCEDCHHEGHPLTSLAKSLLQHRRRLGALPRSSSMLLRSHNSEYTEDYPTNIKNTISLLDQIKSVLTQSRDISTGGSHMKKEEDDQVPNDHMSYNDAWNLFAASRQKVNDGLISLADNLHHLLETQDTVLRKQRSLQDKSNPSISTSAQSIQAALMDLMENFQQLKADPHSKDIQSDLEKSSIQVDECWSELKEQIVYLSADIESAETSISNFKAAIEDNIKISKSALMTLPLACHDLLSAALREEGGQGSIFGK